MLLFVAFIIISITFCIDKLEKEDIRLKEKGLCRKNYPCGKRGKHICYTYIPCNNITINTTTNDIQMNEL